MCPAGAELLHADRQTEGRTDALTDMNLRVAFRNFWNAPNNRVNAMHIIIVPMVIKNSSIRFENDTVSS
jgi:hypothetical protein